ncbi:hypothetical protein L9F63_014542 [Diploptera punctata]|uniref:SET domain-containing protein n=1 Tax=Diploptera punctata TaxID=6984 RepID=A0AAD8EKZ7_DIPPU|nr:hypothetical protein L9F63_014542 [Diploptera punctata]
MYCSEECRSSSWDESHYIECSILPTLQKLEISELSFLVLRVVIKACETNDLKNILTFLEAEDNVEEMKGFNNKGAYSSSDYSSIYWLEAHSEKRITEDLFIRSLYAAYMLHCLETMTDFFTGIDVNQYKYRVGGLLLRHFQNLLINNYCITESLISKEKNLTDIELLGNVTDLGIAVYIMLSLLNHSCDPNAHRTSHRGDTSVLRAIAPIAAGEQVIL